MEQIKMIWSRKCDVCGAAANAIVRDLIDGVGGLVGHGMSRAGCPEHPPAPGRVFVPVTVTLEREGQEPERIAALQHTEPDGRILTIFNEAATLENDDVLTVYYYDLGGPK